MSDVALKRLALIPVKNGLGLAGAEANRADPRYVRITDIGVDGLLRDEVFASQPRSVIGDSWVDEGDVLIASVGGTVGKSYLHRVQGEYCFAGYLSRVRPNRELLDPKYLHFWTQSLHYWDQVRTNQVASTIENLSASRIGALNIPYHDLPKQRAIVDYLDHETAEIDAFIADLQQAEQLIDEHWESSLIKLIQRGLDDSGELIDTGVTTWPQAPPAWGHTRLKNTVHHSKNGAWGSEPSEDEVTVRCIRVADFDKQSSKIHDINPTQRSYPSTVVSAQGLAAGDLLIEKSGGGPTTPVGNVVRYEGDGGELYSNFTARIVVSAGVYSRYALYLHKCLYLTGLTSRSVKQSTGIQNLDMAQYLNEEIYLPPPQEQVSIAQRIEGERIQIDSLREDIHSAMHLARERRAALISAAVTGQIEVTKRHKPVAEVLEDEVRERV